MNLLCSGVTVSIMSYCTSLLARSAVVLVSPVAKAILSIDSLRDMSSGGCAKLVFCVMCIPYR